LRKEVTFILTYVKGFLEKNTFSRDEGEASQPTV